jgi:hypothetical protein
MQVKDQIMQSEFVHSGQISHWSTHLFAAHPPELSPTYDGAFLIMEDSKVQS